MKLTDDLHTWFMTFIDDWFEGDLNKLARETGVTLMTWRNVRDREHESISAKTETALCAAAKISLEELARIAHPNTGATQAPAPTYQDKYDHLATDLRTINNEKLFAAIRDLTDLFLHQP